MLPQLPPFEFPNTPFQWVFVSILMTGLLAACWIDVRTMIIPRKLSVGLAAIGLFANLVRGVWIGCEPDREVGPIGGGLLGLGWGVGGLVVGFLVFLVLYIVGTAGGGDVKLGAAIGAWLGPAYFFLAFLLALPALIVLTLARVALLILPRGSSSQPGQMANQRMQQLRAGVVLSYSLSMTFGVGMVLLLRMGNSLGIFGRT